MKDFHGISSINDCKLLTIDANQHPCGNLCVVEDDNQIPYKIQRVYYLYDVPAGVERGGHSHKQCQEFLIAASGSFDVVIFDGHNSKRVHLNRPNQGLLIVPGIWRTLDNFSSGSVCLVIDSHKFDENDYIRDFDEFIESISNNQK